jgi:hypothetical protein
MNKLPYIQKTTAMLILSLIIFSCEREKQPIIENTDIPLISKVLIGGEIYMEYSYNSANLLSEEKSKFHYAKHNYNDNNQLTSSDFYWDLSMASNNSSIAEAAQNRVEWVNPSNTPKSISHLLRYNKNGELIKKSYVRADANKTDIVEFLYEDDRIKRATGYYNNLMSGYTDYSYDIKGNMIKEKKYSVSPEGVTDLITTTDYEYDEMHNPYLSFKRLTTPGLYTNPNNITKQTLTLNFEVDPSIEKVQVTKNIYEYNQDGYPAKINGVTEYIYR